MIFVLLLSILKIGEIAIIPIKTFRSCPFGKLTEYIVELFVSVGVPIQARGIDGIKAVGYGESGEVVGVILCCGMGIHHRPDNSAEVGEFVVVVEGAEACFHFRRFGSVFEGLSSQTEDYARVDVKGVGGVVAVKVNADNVAVFFNSHKYKSFLGLLSFPSLDYILIIPQ